MHKLFRRISYLIHRSQMDRDLADEMAAHREMLAEDRRAAFGSTLRLREDSHAAWGWVWLERLWQDLNYGRRTIARHPGFALIAVLSLAVGIGANCAIFSLADTLLLRPLPVPDPAGVVTLGSRDVTGLGAAAGLNLLNASYPDYKDIRDRNTSFAGVVAYDITRLGFAARPGALPQLRMGSEVTENFFDVMGVKPELGRTFRPEEDQVPGRDAVIVLSHDLWQQECAGDRSVLGREVRLNGVSFTVIGVMPERFTGSEHWLYSAFYVPLTMRPRLDGDSRDVLNSRDLRFFTLKGRLKRGVPISRARAELAALGKSLEQAYPATNKNQSMDVRTEVDSQIKRAPEITVFLGMLIVLAAAVLLVACANVAGLLTSRAPARAREMSLRVAIGAGRTRLIRQLITESLLLAGAGGLAGVGLGYLGVLLFRQITYPSDLPLLLTIDLNQRALLFSLVIAMLSVFLFGLIPAIRTSRADLTTALKAGGAPVQGRRRVWGRSLLVSGQVAVSLVLLTTSMFLYLGFRESLTRGPGFRIHHLLLMSFDPSAAHYTPEQDHEFYQRLVERSRSLPGVKSVALASFVPMSVEIDSFAIVPEGYRLPPGQDSVSAMANRVDEGYFETAGIPLVRGRGFLKTDTADTPRVAVINETLAEHYWPHHDAIGKRFRLDGEWVEIVGIAKTAKYLSTLEPPADFLYLPYLQHPRGHMTLMLQSAGDPGALAAPLREVARGLDSNLAVYDVRTMDDFYRARAVEVYQVILQAVASMGLMGMALALAGLYGLMAYSVTSRTREIGIRIAIGARRGQVLRMVLRQGFVLALSGMVVGLVLSIAATRLLRAVFPGDSPLAAYLLVMPAVLAVTMLAAYLPARRASRVDPMTALRYE
jgi:macrolide transport system ATP-binding/permease protein